MNGPNPAQGQNPQEARMNPDNLYQEETFTDLKVGSIRRLTPVNPNGIRDKKRKVLYIGQTQLVSPQGFIPVQFSIDARNMREAMERFPEALNEEVNRMVEEAREMQREEASRIIVPGSQPTGPGNIQTLDPLSKNL